MKVKLFGGLRKKAGGSEVFETGSTIREVLDRICAQNEELGAAIFADDGDGLRPHIRIMVNGIDSELENGLETPVEDEDQIAIFPPIAGG